jgi:hypothetical protein
MRKKIKINIFIIEQIYKHVMYHYNIMQELVGIASKSYAKVHKIWPININCCQILNVTKIIIGLTYLKFLIIFLDNANPKILWQENIRT